MPAKKILGTCSVDGCASAATGLNYCNIHYQMVRRHGNPFGPTEGEKLRTRLMRCVVVSSGGCWLWTGHKARFGHGILLIDGKKRGAHRVSWIAHHGPIPDGMCVCHRCDVPACVNPDHLFLGTVKENFDDMRAKNRQPFGERSGRAKLTEGDVRLIRMDTRAQKDIAGEFGITGTLVRKIKNREIWKHVA